MANELVTAAEEQKLSRLIMAWINTYPDLPQTVTRIDFEQLKADKPCMALSAIQGAYITKRYISGGHQGEYQFKLIYRFKPATSNDARLKADELLNALGDWATQNPPVFDDLRVVKVEATTRSAMFAAYENGDVDHQILMKLTYEVI